MTGHEDSLFQQALDHHRAGNLAEASELYHHILQAAPDRTDVLYLLAVIAHQTGQAAQAVELIRRSLAVEPDQARCYNLLGLNLAALRMPDEAEASFRRAIDLDPNHGPALAALGRILQTSSRPENAIPFLQSAIALTPDDADLHCDLGNTLQTLRQFPAADAAYQRSLELNPASARAWYAAACSQGSRKQYATAVACFQKALELQPGWPQAQHNLAEVLFKLGQVDRALDLFRQAAAAGAPALSLAAIALIIPGSLSSGNQSILEARRTWAENQLPQTRSAGHPSTCVRTAGRTWRIGYVSSFFQDHNWMKPVWGLINHHDRQSFEVHLFSDAPASQIEYGYDAHPQDRFHNTASLSNQELARVIESAGIHLLVDLNGYSTMGRLPLFTMRPAPVVAGWFNMYATTGIAAYDYLIGDHQVIPPEEEIFYCEKILRVPGSYLTFEVTYPVPPVSDPPCLANQAITFGCLASQYKITSEVIGAWSTVLRQVPNSSLILKNAALGSPGVREFVYGLFELHHISSERVHLEGPSDHYNFLETYGKIDIALDTFPYNGGTTTTEAIWQGVPVVAFSGDRWAARTSASILRSAALPELVGHTLEDYISLAISLANSPDRLRDLRRNMRSQLRDSPVCDTPTFARNMESLYTQAISQ